MLPRVIVSEPPHFSLFERRRGYLLRHHNRCHSPAWNFTCWLYQEEITIQFPSTSYFWGVEKSDTDFHRSPTNGMVWVYNSMEPLPKMITKGSHNLICGCRRVMKAAPAYSARVQFIYQSSGLPPWIILIKLASILVWGELFCWLLGECSPTLRLPEVENDHQKRFPKHKKLSDEYMTPFIGNAQLSWVLS